MSRYNNYFFQSEQEFLYNGNLGNAKANIQAVTGTIYLIRFVFNYISTFIIPDVSKAINGIKIALVKLGPFALIISELARLGWALAESAVDLVALIYNQDVKLLKLEAKDWYLGPRGSPELVKLIANIAAEAVIDSMREANVELDNLGEILKSAVKDEWTLVDTPVGGINVGTGGISFESSIGELSYSNYLLVLLLFRNSDLIAERIATLISLNITTQKYGIENAQRFYLRRAKTDFSITTTVDMRMIFLSMPLAQSGVRGVVPPRSIPLTAIDHRGY
jgi:hypothetical protein